MKRIFACICCAAAILSASAYKPIMVGHRGSGYGVESTEEAFRRGAELGYSYVESDIKVTADTRFVLSHDDDTKRLGGTLTIASSTLEQLQSETLTQTRNGVTYTGTLMCLEQWLQLCDELDLKPLIELKWATGINNNDQSNIPKLISTLETAGFRNRCIILTSMKPCLTYIRTHYPDIELQFLTGQYWANHFQWCADNGIDADIQSGCFEFSTVTRYHNAGLKVNMWTTNDLAGYKKYASWGCDFITTDRLDANAMPEVEILTPPDPPTPVDLVWECLWVRSNVNGNVPEHIDGTNAQQGTAVEGLFYVNDCAERLLYVFHQGDCTGSMPGGAGWGCCRDDAGNIIVRNDKNTDGNLSFLVYRAGSTPASYEPATPIQTTVPLSGQTNFINAAGDVLGQGGRIYLYPNGQKGINIVEVAGGAVVEARAITGLEIAGSAAGYVVPTANSDAGWYYQVRNKGIYKWNGTASEDFSTGASSTTAPARNSTGGMAFADINGNLIFFHNSGANYKGGFTVRNTTLSTIVANIEPIGNLAYVDGGNRSTFNWIICEPEGPGAFNVYQYCPANGMAQYRLYDRLSGISAPAASADIVLNLENRILRVSGLEPEQTVKVYSITGRLMSSGTCAYTSLESLPRGIYIVRIGSKGFKISL